MDLLIFYYYFTNCGVKSIIMLYTVNYTKVISEEQYQKAENSALSIF